MRVTVAPESTVAVAVFGDVSEPAAPVAVAVAVAGGGPPLMERLAVSLAAPSTQVFCSVSVARWRVLVNVQTTLVGAAGTV